MQHSFVMVAGGSGRRMQQQTPKQFLLLHNQRLVYYTIYNLIRAAKPQWFVIVAPEEHWIIYQVLLAEHAYFGLEHTHFLWAHGGETRTESVRNGLWALYSRVPEPEKHIVAVHDAARPLITPDLVSEALEKAERLGNAIPVVPVKSSLRQVTDNQGNSKAVERSQYLEVQTPQCFNLAKLVQAYSNLALGHSFTDCASVWEYAGQSVNTSTGNYFNIKITTPEDLIIAESFLSQLNRNLN